MEMVRRLRPDIVLCDIVMPVEDGLTLVRSLHETLPDIRVILITGYASQAYMMEAIHSCVRDYLLKPVGTEQILSSVLKVRDEIQRERAQLLERKGRDALFTENLVLLRQHFAGELLAGRLCAQQIGEMVRHLSIDLRGPEYAFVLAQCPCGGGWDLAQQLSNLFCAYDPLITRLPETGVLAAILNLEGELDADGLTRRAQRIPAGSRPAGAMILSRPAPALEQLAPLYPAALAALRRGIWYGAGAVVPMDRVQSAPFPLEDIKTLEYRLFDAIQEGDPLDIRRSAQHLLDRLIELKPDMDTFDQLLNRVEQTVNALCRNAGGPSLPRLGQCSLDQLRQAFFQLCCQGKSENRALGSGQVGRALRYIEHHYNTNISLESMAAQLYISPTYLSRLLNEKTELGFYGWLNYFRIEKARELLLHTDMKHYEIAEAVGYSSYKVFSEHFQQITGCTASQYRFSQRRARPEKKEDP